MAQGFGKGLVHGLLFGGAALAVLSLLAQQAEMTGHRPSSVSVAGRGADPRGDQPETAGAAEPVARASLPDSPARPSADAPSSGLALDDAPQGGAEALNMPVWHPTPEEADAPIWEVLPTKTATDSVIVQAGPEASGTTSVSRYEVAIDPPKLRDDSQTDPAQRIESPVVPTAASEFARPATDLPPPSPAGQTAPARAARPPASSASPDREAAPTQAARVTVPAPTPPASTAQTLTEPAPLSPPVTPTPEAGIPVSPPGQVATPQLDRRPAVRDTEPAGRDPSVPDLLEGLPDMPDLMGEG